MERDVIELHSHNMILGHLIPLSLADLSSMCDEALPSTSAKQHCRFEGTYFLKSVKPFAHARLV